MRIISGSLKVKTITPPASYKARPTTDFAREALFDVLNNEYEFEDLKVLDLFGGSGQLGIEALSRGARETVFVDSSKNSVQLIRENLKRCGLEAGVLQTDALSYLSRGEKFDVIFIDPPYDGGLYSAVLERINAVDNLTEGGIIIVEARREQPLPDLAAPYGRRKEYRYGKIKIAVYTKENEL